jgi:hypothetical protein
LEIKGDSKMAQTRGKRATKTTAKATLDGNMLVTVYNNTNGKLIYASPRNGTTWVWDNYGDFDQMELSELMSMKSTYPRFFQENWVHIEDPEVIEFLRLEQYMKNTLVPDELDNFFDLDVEAMKEILDKANAGTKTLVLGRARELIESGELDSSRKIKLISEVTGVNLEEEA